MHLHLSEVTIVFFIFSFLGWCMEVFLKLVDEHIFVNRGFLIGPYCPVYGFGVIFIIFMIGDVLTLPYGIFPVFLSGMMICGVLEYFVSWFLEKRYHARWWDYSTKPLNIHGRVWIGNLILFGIASVVIMAGIYPLLRVFLDGLSECMKWTVSCIIIFIMGADALTTRHAMRAIRHQIEGCSPDDTEEISYYIHEYLHQMPYTVRHLDQAFPAFHISDSFIKQQLTKAKTDAIRTIQKADTVFEMKKDAFRSQIKDQFSKEEQKRVSRKSVYNNISVKKEEKENE